MSNRDEPNAGCGSSDAAAPVELRLNAARESLSIVWSDGLRHELTAQHLRGNCQSAGAKRLRLDRWDVPSTVDLTIDDIRPVGSYAINIAFSDGHARGIYPWSLLRALATEIPADQAIS